LKYLPKIDSPDDLKRVPVGELPIVCREIREYIVSVVNEVGGHFASSLGAVELTVALHYVYNTPSDRICWDVGHQGYVHKVLTGRREALRTMRQSDGISGFLKRSESPYDHFGAGHASTAISAALGMAEARSKLKQDYRVVAVVGDGSLTGGLAYEALNNAGHLQSDLLVILNDNKMSISPNVGALHDYLTRIITHPQYRRLKHDIWDWMGKVPAVSGHLREAARRVDEGVKSIFVPGGFFEDLSFKYFGPTDGHNVLELVELLGRLKEERRPILLHCLTQKGKGCDYAEMDPIKWHGVSPAAKAPAPTSSSAASTPKPKEAPAYLSIAGEQLCLLAARDERIVAITAAMAEGTGLVDFASRFPDRFYDVGIAEGHAVCFAAGLAAAGMRPVCAIYSTFLQRAYDQIMHDVALQHLPVVFLLDRGGLVGADGPTHHGALDLAYLSCIPGMVVAAPRNGTEFKNLLYTALAQDQYPFAIRYPKDQSLDYDPSEVYQLIPLGQWEVLKPGHTVALVAVGAMVPVAESAARLLAADGTEAEVVNARYVKPLDTDRLSGLAGRFDVIVTLEEGVVRGGFGETVAAFCQAQPVRPGRVITMGLPDAFVPHGTRSELLAGSGLTAEHVVTAVRQALRDRAVGTERRFSVGSRVQEAE
jgi:1-deoxy-D-xylulose-5-phosphate synthase